MLYNMIISLNRQKLSYSNNKWNNNFDNDMCSYNIIMWRVNDLFYYSIIYTYSVSNFYGNINFVIWPTLKISCLFSQYFDFIINCSAEKGNNLLDKFNSVTFVGK